MKVFRIIKYFGLASLASLIIVSPVFAASSSVATKSNELKMRACQAREQVIKTRMNNLQRLSSNMLGVFDKIEKRVEEFYQNKVLANGKSVSNYDTLVQTAKTKKDAVQTALTKTSQDSASFSCSTDNPKLALLTFRKDMISVKSALKDYRTSIKNLIVAVKSVTAVVEKEKLSGTPKPSGTEAK